MLLPAEESVFCLGGGAPRYPGREGWKHASLPNLGQGGKSVSLRLKGKDFTRYRIIEKRETPDSSEGLKHRGKERLFGLCGKWKWS